MPRIKPYAGTSVVRLGELIRLSQSPILPTAVKYVFSGMVAGVDGATTITAVASVGTRVDPPKDVQYTRLSIDALSLLPPEFLELVPATEVPFNIHSILPAINTALGIDLDPSEVEDTLFTEEASHYPLTIIADASLAWVESTYYFKMADLDIDLDKAIVDPVLDGLVYIQPVE